MEIIIGKRGELIMHKVYPSELDIFPNDTICAYCEKPLPKNIELDSWPWYGFCNCKCFLRFYQEGITNKETKSLLDKALTELQIPPKGIEYVRGPM